MRVCNCLIHHAATEEERKAICEALEYARVLGDSAGITLAMSQLQPCPKLGIVTTDESVIASGPTIPGKLGDHYPTRVVLRQLSDEKYVTYIEVFDHDLNHREYMWGHYFTDAHEARIDFSDRVSRGY